MTDDPTLRIVSGTPTDEETAAIAAVFTQLALEEAASSLPLPETAPPTAWQRSTRTLRTPLPLGTAWQGH